MSCITTPSLLCKLYLHLQVLIYPVMQSYNYHTGSYLDQDLTNLRKYVSYYLAGDLSITSQAGDPTRYSGTPAYWSAVVEPDSSPGKELEIQRALESSASNLNNVYCFPLLECDPAGLPPTYVLALTRDAIRDDAAHYAAWLRHCGVYVCYEEEGQANHGFMFLYGTDELARKYLHHLADFVHQHVA